MVLVDFRDLSIKYYRKKANLSQENLAKKLGITRTDMSFIENKKIYPDTKTAEMLAEILGIPIGKIYSGEELEIILYKNKK